MNMHGDGHINHTALQCAVKKILQIVTDCMSCIQRLDVSKKLSTTVLLLRNQRQQGTVAHANGEWT
ncbi:MAG: hypothetical protein ACKPJJ_09710 [Planctomycetaceae bacterium]